MRRPPTEFQPSCVVLAALLALAILCAQWVGLNHRIVHAGLQQSSLSAPQADDRYDRAAEHSCILLDAATLAFGPGTPPFAAALLPGAPVLALWMAFASWDAPHLCHFSSRAPPR